jgi:hypothetical protein
MYSVLRAIVLGLFVWLVAASSASAGIAVLADGADGRSARIAIRSAIKKGDLAAFEAAIERVSQTARTQIAGVSFVTVELNSPGGDVVEALGIGRVIYEHSAFTMVRQGQECVSACVFILAAGAVRTPLGSANIGVHKPLLVAWHHMDYNQARAKYNGLMQYLRQYLLDLGVSADAYDIMMRTSSSDMRYFSPTELERLRLRGVSPEWLSHYGLPSHAAGPSEPMQAAISANVPKLAKIDESYRYIVFMPGDLPLSDYYAGTPLHTPHFVWDSLDDAYQPIDWSAPDIVGVLKKLCRALWSSLGPIVGPNWWLIALILFEVVRGWHWPWPDRGSADRSWRDRWRLAPLRPYQCDQSSFNSGS